LTTSRQQVTIASSHENPLVTAPVQQLTWKQRFQNFDRAFLRLRSALENGLDSLNQLEKEGVIQRFEFSFEPGQSH
jgi:hypothetical protein